MAAGEEQDEQEEPRAEGVGDAWAPGSGEAPSAAHHSARRLRGTAENSAKINKYLGWSNPSKALLIASFSHRERTVRSQPWKQ